MNYKKLTQILIIVVASIWVFCITLMASYKIVLSKQSVPAAETTTSAQQTTQPQSTSTTKYTVPAVTIDGNHVVTSAQVDKPQWLIEQEESKKASIEASKEASRKKEEEKNTTKAYVPSGKKEIINAYTEAVNNAKKTKNLTVVKTEKLSTEIDSITGGDRAKSIADEIIASNARDGSTTYRFVNSIDDATGLSPTNVIAPADIAASLDSDDVKSATATAGTNGSYSVKITLGQQVQTLDTPAPGYATAMEVIAIDSLGIPSSVNITSLEITYDNSYIEAVIDKDGRLTSMKHYIEVVNTVGKGTLLIVPVSIEMHGSYTTDYKFSY